MLIQVTAYECLGGLSVQVTTAKAHPQGYGWEHRILESIDTKGMSEPWDLIWLIGQLMSERAIERAPR